MAAVQIELCFCFCFLVVIDVFVLFCNLRSSDTGLMPVELAKEAYMSSLKQTLLIVLQFCFI